MKYIPSVLFGLLAFGWVQLSYLLLSESLYFSFEVRPNVEYCREFIQGDFCNGVAYVSLWLMELPLLMGSFLLFSLFLVVLKKYVERLRLNIFVLVASYVSTNFIFFLLGSHESKILMFAFSTALFHGVFFLISAKLLHLLARRTKTAGFAWLETI